MTSEASANKGRDGNAGYDAGAPGTTRAVALALGAGAATPTGVGAAGGAPDGTAAGCHVPTTAGDVGPGEPAPRPPDTWTTESSNVRDTFESSSMWSRGTTTPDDAESNDQSAGAPGEPAPADTGGKVGMYVRAGIDGAAALPLVSPEPPHTSILMG